MRNFFILCAATALASAVSLSHVNDNEYTGLAVVGKDYGENEYDMYEENADKHDGWVTSLAQTEGSGVRRRSLSRSLSFELRPLPTPTKKHRPTPGDNGIDVGKSHRPRSSTVGVKKNSANLLDWRGAIRSGRSTPTTELPDVKINRPSSISKEASLRKLDRTESVGTGPSGPLKLKRSNRIINGVPVPTVAP